MSIVKKPSYFLSYLTIYIQQEQLILVMKSRHLNGGKELLVLYLIGHVLQKKVFLIRPSSASAERAFSILNNSFGDRQDNSLEDYIDECSVIIQFNKQ